MKTAEGGLRGTEKQTPRTTTSSILNFKENVVFFEDLKTDLIKLHSILSRKEETEPPIHNII